LNITGNGRNNNDLPYINHQNITTPSILRGQYSTKSTKWCDMMTECQQVTIAQDRLAGATYREIAANHGISHQHVGRILNREEIKDILTTGMQAQITLIPKAIDNYQVLLQSPDEAIKLKASQDILKNTGLAPTNAPITMINNILNVNANETPEVIKQLLSAVTHSDNGSRSLLTSDEVIDVTPEGQSGA
jgi:hypothetical protein